MNLSACAGGGGVSPAHTTDSPAKRGNSGAGSSGSPAKHETSTSPVKLRGNDEAHELSSAVCRVFMQHGLAPPGPNTDARVDAIVEAIKSTNVQNLGRKIDRLRLDGGEEWNKLQRKIAHQADNADQTNRQKSRAAVSRLFTHNPLTDPEV